MGIRRGSISTPIIADGLVFNIDAANRASYVPNATLSHNTINPLISGSFSGVTFSPLTGSGVWNFDGIDDYIDCGNDASLNITGALTVSVWVRPSTNSNQGTFISKRSSSNTNYQLLPYGAGVRFYVGSEHPGGSSFSLQQNMWTHIVGVFRPGQSIDLYWKGSLNQTTSTSTTTANTVTNPVVIGSSYNQNAFFSGVIGPVHIYNRALSANEVLHNYNALKSRFGL